MNEDDKRISHGWIFSLLILGIILFLLINVTTVIEAMREALKMCAHSIIPSLFPSCSCLTFSYQEATFTFLPIY